MVRNAIDTDLLDAYRIQLSIMDDTENITEQGEVKDPKIRKLLETTEQSDWFDVYEAEQRLVQFMTDSQIRASATSRFEEARSLKVQSASVLEEAFKKAADDKDRKAVFANLIDDIHFRYTKRRIDRAERNHSAKIFYTSGIIILLPLLAFLLMPNLKNYLINTFGAPMHIVVALYFGVLGAYFSRIIAFQSSLDVLDYDVLVRDYSLLTLVIRLLTGLIGALLMYLLIHSQLVGGKLFPDTSNISMWRMSANGREFLPLPNYDFSKLIIWSVIAGFSERLIPDQLARLGTSVETRASR